MQQQAIQVFKELFLGAGSSATATDLAVSQVMAVFGNKVTLATQVINSANLPTLGNTALTVVVQGSIDGSAWVNVLAQTLDGTALPSGSPEYEQVTSNSGWSYPFARVSAVLSEGTDPTQILFNVTIGFSDQGS